MQEEEEIEEEELLYGDDICMVYYYHQYTQNTNYFYKKGTHNFKDRVYKNKYLYVIQNTKTLMNEPNDTALVETLRTTNHTNERHKSHNNKSR